MTKLGYYIAGVSPHTTPRKQRIRECCVVSLVGQVWGPQAQLTYWALQQYPHVPEVAKARGALAKQMTAMGVK